MQHPEVKQSISRSVREQLAKDIQTAIGEMAPHRLLIDMWRLSGESIIDGRPVFDGVSRMMEEDITDATHGLYQKLTPQQRAALVEVGSQSGFADVHQGMASFPNDFNENFVLGGDFQRRGTVLSAGKRCLTVRQTTRRLMSEEAHLEFNINGPKRDIYPHFQMAVTLTIPPDGQVKCVDFHASAHVEAAR